MGQKLQRDGDVQKITIPLLVANAQTIEFTDEADLLLCFPSTWTSATLTWFTHHAAADEWLEIKDASVADTYQLVAASTAVQIPPACF